MSPRGPEGLGDPVSHGMPAGVTRALRWTVRVVLALGLSGLAFAWAFQDVDLDTVIGRLSESRVTVLVGFLVVQLVLHGVRVFRWGLLVRPLGRASWRSVFAAASVGFAAAFFLPLRLGEFVRPAMVVRSGVPFGGAVASVFVERVADGLFNLGLFFVLLRFVPGLTPSAELVGFYNLALLLFGGGLVVLVGVVLFRNSAHAVIRATVGLAATRLAERLVGLVDRFAEGVLVLGRPARIAGFLALTVAYWGLNGVATWMLAASYVPGLPVLAGPFSVSVVVFAITIPAGPAFAGTLEAGVRFGLRPFAVASEPAAVVALALHALQLLQMALVAGVGLFVAEASEREAMRADPLAGAARGRFAGRPGAPPE